MGNTKDSPRFNIAKPSKLVFIRTELGTPQPQLVKLLLWVSELCLLVAFDTLEALDELAWFVSSQYFSFGVVEFWLWQNDYSKLNFYFKGDAWS